MTREMQHESEKSSSDSKPGFANSATDEKTIRRMELGRVSDAFRSLESVNPRTPGAEQWRKFSDEVFNQIEKQPSGLGSHLRTLRDKINATDSRAIRAVAVVAIIAITLLAAALVWLAISLALPHPVPRNAVSAIAGIVRSLTA